MAFTCTRLRNEVSTSMVICSAMIHGGHAGMTTNNLLPLMKKGKIHIPSPLRLLQLVNGKRCEFCFNHKVNFVRPEYGVFACWSYTTGRLCIMTAESLKIFHLYIIHRIEKIHSRKNVYFSDLTVFKYNGFS
jgi:hypothetical protein